MRHRRPSARGFTLFEILVAVAVLAAMMAAFGRAFVGASRLSSVSRVRMRAEADHRRSLESLAARLRSVEVEALGEVDAHGEARTLTYRAVTGHDGRSRIRGPREQLEWRPGTRDGAVVVVHEDGTVEPVAPGVRQGGFGVELVGNELVVRLTTDAVGDGGPGFVAGTVAVALRN